jgi:hypothetical protein
MSLEKQLQNRLLGITPSHEQQLRYAAIFRAHPELAFGTAYIDGWLAACNLCTKTIEENVKNIERQDTSTS